MNTNDQPLLPKTPPPIDLAETDVGGRGCDFLTGEVKVNDGNLKEGYLKLFRSIQDNPFWTQPRVFSDAEAWIDILLAVRWKKEPEQKVIGRKVLICNRGESLKSLDTWKRRWQWHSKKRVTSFLKMLEKMEMIRLTNETVTTRLFVVHYNEYQDYGNANVNTQGNALGADGKRIGNGEETDGKRKGHTEEEVKPTNPPIIEDGNKVILSRSKPSEASESFLKFWDSYPHSRRTGKPQCLKVWKTKGLDSMIETILTALENHKASNDWQKEGGQYIPGSAVWLNQERWEQKMDVVTPQPIQSKSPPLVSTPGKRVVSAEDFTRETDELRVRLRAGGQ